MGAGVSRSPGSLHVGCKKRKPDVDRGPGGEVLCPGGEVAEKVDIFEITGDAFNRRPMCHIARVVLFFSSSKSKGFS